MSNVSLLIYGSCLLSLIYSIYAIRAVMAAPPDNKRMQEIAQAIQEGASAFLARQYKTIAIVGLLIGLLLGYLLGIKVAIGYFIGAKIVPNLKLKKQRIPFSSQWNSSLKGLLLTIN